MYPLNEQETKYQQLLASANKFALEELEANRGGKIPTASWRSSGATSTLRSAARVWWFSSASLCSSAVPR